MDLSDISHPFFRTDPLTGSGNLLGFLERLARLFEEEPRPALSLMALDVNFFAALNRAEGLERGDDALRWLVMVLGEETQSTVYRVGGDEFVIVLDTGALTDHTDLAERIFAQLNQDAAKFGLPAPAVSLALIHYMDAETITVADALLQISAAVFEVKRNMQRTIATFQAATMQLPSHPHGILTNMINRIVSLGVMLDNWHQLAYTDPVSDLPNLRAALQRLGDTLGKADASQPFAVLLIDGDNLRRYNDIGYAAGDEMIQRLSQTLQNQLRPTDFIARWRVGDEFLIVLPHTPLDHAVAVAERLCQVVQHASQTWVFPVTISLGVAAYPQHGATIDELLAQAETSVDAAKTQGKNRVVVAAPPATTIAESRENG